MKHSRKKKLLVILTIAFTIIYMTWRVVRTIPLEYGIFSTICGITLLVVELVGTFEMIVHFAQLSDIQLPKRPELKAEDYPEVDILISTYNEPPELLYKTINGCLNMDYPDKSKVHIYLCDDGHREEMGILSERMRITHLVRDTHQFAKAGNLNHAMSVTSSPYIVTFDADMIPRHDFLTACIPYFFGEEEIGFLQTPQTFYNPDLFQYNLYSENRIPNEQDYFYRDVQIMRNKSNAVIYGGTNTILSRKALEDAGGFYTGVITEDFATGMMIQSKGYRCYAIDESHASGMAPEDLKSLVKQRERWARGCIQTGRKIHIFFSKNLSLSQKISYITSITYWYGAIKRFVYIMSPILYAVFGVIVVKCTLPQVLIFWLPMYLLNNATLRLLSRNIRNTRITSIYETIMFPSLLPAVILESLGISKKKFVVTRKDGKNKRQEENHWYKFKYGLPLIILLILSIFGIGRYIAKTFTTGTPTYIVIIFWLLVNMFSLLMAVFFMFGRKSHRQYERFDVSVDCLILFGDRLIKTKTDNISENGISVILDFPEFIPPKENIRVSLATDLYETTWYGRVTNVMNVNGKWKFGFQISDITEENLRQMLQIVYDREPTLPKEIGILNSMADDLLVNIWNRTKGQEYYSRKLARVELKNWVKTDSGDKLLLRDFNYEYITFQFYKGKRIPEHITLKEKLFKIRCSLVEEHAKLGACYKIDNYDEISSNIEFRNVLKSWMYGYENQIGEENMHLKRVEAALKENIFFEELEYL